PRPIRVYGSLSERLWPQVFPSDAFGRQRPARLPIGRELHSRAPTSATCSPTWAACSAPALRLLACPRGPRRNIERALVLQARRNFADRTGSISIRARKDQ